MSRTPIRLIITLLSVASLGLVSGCGSSADSPTRYAAQDGADVAGEVALPPSPIDPFASLRKEEFSELKRKMCSSFARVPGGEILNLAGLGHCALVEGDEADPAGRIFWTAPGGLSCLADLTLKDLGFFEEERLAITARTSFRNIRKTTWNGNVLVGEMSVACTDSAKAMLGTLRFQLGKSGEAQLCLGTAPCATEQLWQSEMRSETRTALDLGGAPAFTAGNFGSAGEAFTLTASNYAFVGWVNWGDQCRAQVVMGGGAGEGALQLTQSFRTDGKTDESSIQECVSREGNYRFDRLADESAQGGLTLEKL